MHRYFKLNCVLSFTYFISRYQVHSYNNQFFNLLIELILLIFYSIHLRSYIVAHNDL